MRRRLHGCTSPLTPTAWRGSSPGPLRVTKRRLGTWSLAAALGFAVAGPILIPATAAAATSDVVRLAGADRYGTALAVSGQYSPGVPAVYVATGASYADAIAAGAAAGSASPVLLVPPTGPTTAIVAEVARLKPGTVILVGGPTALPSVIGDTLGPLAAGGWTRISGADRYGTAAALSAATFAPGVKIAYLASGTAFPDALTAASLGAINGSPVLLTDPNRLPAVTAAELARLGPAQVAILGGPSAVSATVATTVGALVGNVSRAAGPSRYATNTTAYATNAAAAPVLSNLQTVIVATGANFPDALAGSALAGHAHTALILAGPDGLTADQQRLIYTLHPASVTVIGGEQSVSTATAAAVLAATTATPPALDPDAANYLLRNWIGGQVVRWNPCQAIGWQLNPGGGLYPDAKLPIVTAAFAQIASATGLTFRYDGLTTYLPMMGAIGQATDDIVVAFAIDAAEQTPADHRYDGYVSDVLHGGGPVPDGMAVVGSTVARPTTTAAGNAVIGHAVVVLDSMWADHHGLSDFMGIGRAGDVGYTVMHELGHAVGLAHAPVAGDLMYFQIPDVGNPYFSAGDLAGFANVGMAAGCLA